MSYFRAMSALLLAVLAFTVAHALAASDDASIIQRALELQQAGDFARAADQYRAFLKLHPDEPAARSNLGTVLVKLGRYDEAIEQYEAARRLLPGDSRIELNLALAYSKSGRVAQACQRFGALHDATPQDPKITLLAADCQLRLGENNRVVELLEPAERGGADDLATAYLLATALVREHRNREAQVLLDRVLRNGDTAEARFLAGTESYEAGDYPAAVKELARAAELNPDLPQLQSFYGLALLNTGDSDAATAAFHKELAANPNDFPSNLALGQILVARQRFSEALPFLGRASQLQPRSLDATLALGECFSDLGRLDEARTRLEIVTGEVPASLEAHRALLSVDMRLHLRQEAEHERATVDRLQRAGDRATGGPSIDDFAPDFELADAAAKQKVRLSSFRGKSPVVLVFGSYSCPNFRSSAEALKALYRDYGDHVPFFLIYIREAHATGSWQTMRNEREGIALDPAATMQQKEGHARMCSLKLHLPFPALVDKLDGATETAYAAWPSRAFVIGIDGRVRYSTRLTELDFHPQDMESALRRSTADARVQARSAIRSNPR